MNCMTFDECQKWLSDNYYHLVKDGERISGSELARRIEASCSQDNPKNKFAVSLAKRILYVSKSKKKEVVC